MGSSAKTMKTAFWKRITLLVFVPVIFFASGFYIGKFGFKDPRFVSFSLSDAISNRNSSNLTDFGLFWNVWDMLGQTYYDSSKLNTSDMIYGAIKGMVAAVNDPYTVFLTPSENKTVEDDLRGSFEGVGIQIGFKDKNLTVISPLPDTPAKRAGILAGDMILAIKDQGKGISKTTSGMSIDEAVALIKGPKGTEVSLLIAREGDEQAREITVKRDKIEVPSVDLEYVEGVAHLKVLKFSSDTQSEWNDAVADIQKSKTTDIVLDLRGNPGGYMQAAVDLAADFLPVGTLVVIEDSRVYGKMQYTTKTQPRLAKYKTVVLVDGGSASASEILAMALREKANFTIIGTQSFGKGTIQEPKDLRSKSGIHITIGKWLSPLGVWVNEKGITPDVVVKDDPDTTDDEQLTKALEILFTKD